MSGAGLNRLVRYWETALFDHFELTPVHDTPRSARRLRRVLVLSVSAGNGHVRAAEAIVAHGRAEFPQLSLRHRDLMQLVPAGFRRLYSDLYLQLASRMPEVWGWLYRRTDRVSRNSLPERLRRRVQSLCCARLFDEIAEFAPDAIVCTHFLPAEILGAAAAAGKLRCPVWVQVTDFDLHGLWVQEGVAGYAVANEELAFRLRQLGVPESRILVSGIPVMPAFAAPPDRAVAAARLGIEPARPTLLMMGGGAGVGLDAARIRALLARHPDLQLVVLAGRNAALLQSLKAMELFYPQQLRAVGFTDDVAAIMACADLAITKPGGLSTSECLVMGLPMLLVNPIPGQEERNAALLLQEGVALRADDPDTLQFRLNQLLSSPGTLARMRTRAQALGRPQAAQALLHRLHG